MAILKIARMGDEVLKRVAEPVEDPAASEIAKLADDMRETLEDIGGNGLAAPQVHVSKRMVVYRVAGGGYANALSDYHGFAGSGFEEPRPPQ